MHSHTVDILQLLNRIKATKRQQANIRLGGTVQSAEQAADTGWNPQTGTTVAKTFEKVILAYKPEAALSVRIAQIAPVIFATYFHIPTGLENDPHPERRYLIDN